MARPRISRGRGILLAFASAFAFAAFGSPASPDAIAASYATTYFAPISTLPCGVWRLRTPEGGFRQFESVVKKRGRMQSEDGWTAGTDGRKSWVKTPPGVRPALKISYEDGVPVSVKAGRKTVGIAAPGFAVCTNDLPAVIHWPETWTRNVNVLFSKSLFQKDGRLQLWFASGQNRAGAFLAMLLLAGLSLALAARGLPFRIGAAAFAVLSLVGVFLTQSRGALMASLVSVGLVEVCWLHGRGLLTRKRFRVAALVTVLLGLLVLVLFVVVLPRGVMSYVKSDGLRWAMLRGFPRMMCDAPWGWGFGKCGAAYADWYNSPAEWRYQACLFSDHLSILADLGWLGGALYLLIALTAFFGLLRLAWSGGPTLPLGVWSVLLVSGCFNPVLFARTMLWLPLLALVPILRDRRWLRLRFWTKPLIAGAGCSLVILLVIWIVGENVSTAPQIRRQGSAVFVNGDSPRIWLVADDDVLGSFMMPKDEIRWFYWTYPNAPAIGIVHDLDDLGCSGVRRLVLSGRHCEEFLRRHRGDSFRKGIPPEIVFLSPGFSATAVPQELRARSEVAVVMGEFAARYHADMVNPPRWAIVVKGAELYIPGWMRYFVPTDGREGGR